MVREGEVVQRGPKRLSWDNIDQKTGFFPDFVLIRPLREVCGPDMFLENVEARCYPDGSKRRRKEGAKSFRSLFDMTWAVDGPQAVLRCNVVFLLVDICLWDGGCHWRRVLWTLRCWTAPLM